VQIQTRFVQPVVGVIVDTSVRRPDAALALAALYSATTRGGLRVCSVCVTGSGLGAAILCDVIGRFYVPRVASSNTVLPVGLDASGTLPADSPMVKAAIDRKKADGDPQYVRSVQRVTDTSLAEAVLRNAVTLTTELVVVLSGPATSLARALELEGTKATVKQRVKRLVIADAGAARTDGPALKQLLADWPTPIFFCGHEVGEALPFPGAKLDQLFGWAPAHPVVDAYRAFKSMPYDAPMYDVAALQYAIAPDADVFTVSGPGTLSVGSRGTLEFSPGEGGVRQLGVEPAKRAQALDTLVKMASEAPTPPAARGRRGG
jgi:hypothetical protein